MQVDASIDESDVARIRIGLRATFTVDAFPGQTFEGQIRQVRKAAQNVSNVVTYVVVIGFSNTGGRLLPGMTANVRVVTEQRDNVLKVPNAALRVRIAGVEPASSAKVRSWLPEAIAQPAGEGAGTRGRIYLLGEDGKPRAFDVRLGVTDRTATELMEPVAADAAQIKEGATVITGVSAPPAGPSGSRISR